MSLFHSLLTCTQTSFPASLFSGMQVWHTISDNGGISGSTITNITDLSGNGRTGTASGSQRTLRIESNGFKTLSSNGTNDKIQIPSTLNMSVRTVAVLVKQNSIYDRWGDFYGLLSRETIGGNNFTLALDANPPIPGGGARSLISGIPTSYTSVQTDNILPSYYPLANAILAQKGDWGLMQEYHLVIIELLSNVTIDTTTLAWLQERGDGTRYFKNYFSDGWIWDRVLTTQEKEDFYLWAKNVRKYKNIYNAPNNIIFDGNSLSVGATATFSSSPITLALSSLGSNYTGGSLGYGSALTPDLVTRFDDIIGLRKRNGFTKNIYIPWECSNQLAVSQASAATTFASYTQLCDKARNVGFIVIGTTVIDRQDAFATAYPAFQTERASLNTSIRNYHSSLSEEICDFAANSNLSNANNTTYFNADKVHLTNTGCAVVGQIISDSVVLV